MPLRRSAKGRARGKNFGWSMQRACELLSHVELGGGVAAGSSCLARGRGGGSSGASRGC